MMCYRWMPHHPGAVFLVVEPGRETIATVTKTEAGWEWTIGADEHRGRADTATAAGKRVMEILRHAGEALDHSNSAFRRLCHLQDADQATSTCDRARTALEGRS